MSQPLIDLAELIVAVKYYADLSAEIIDSLILFDASETAPLSEAISTAIKNLQDAVDDGSVTGQHVLALEDAHDAALTYLEGKTGTSPNSNTDD
jgi:hypothetical protein